MQWPAPQIPQTVQWDNAVIKAQQEARDRADAYAAARAAEALVPTAQSEAQKYFETQKRQAEERYQATKDATFKDYYTGLHPDDPSAVAQAWIKYGGVAAGGAGGVSSPALDQYIRENNLNPDGTFPDPTNPNDPTYPENLASGTKKCIQTNDYPSLPDGAS